tara:strand:- start:32 stop:589 length:558 start_codon:yes stop_codon:yes gene_type:complete
MDISKKKFLERKNFKKLREQSSFTDRRNVENNVKIYIDLFLKKYKKIKNIAIYWPLRNEVDIRNLKNKYSLALPRCGQNKRLSFFLWDDKPLSEDSEGILSPENTNLLNPDDISLIFIPCLSIDKNLVRLGYGGGYFDKLREDRNWRNIPCIGLLTSNCFSNIPLTRADWDIPLSGFITEKEIFV